MKYPFIHTIRYMGNKSNLLDFIVPEIESLTNPGDTVCDIMAGTNSIGYALKSRNKIISNDIQYYSYFLGLCMLKSCQIPTAETVHYELDAFYEENFEKKHYTFFEDNYTDTYFSADQCKQIDSLRFAIEKNKENKPLYLSLLMSAMCKAQSTTGHFAQFMPKDHKRIIPLRSLSVVELFYEKLKDFDNYIFEDKGNCCYNMDYNELLHSKVVKDTSCYYLDSPYTSDQYSRFYHILETVCKYDYPVLKYKAKYRENRTKSLFCYRKTAKQEFEKIIEHCHKNNASLVISYSNHGVIPYTDIINIAKDYYKDIKIKNQLFSHSSQGSGTININEVLLIMDKEDIK